MRVRLRKINRKKHEEWKKNLYFNRNCFRASGCNVSLDVYKRQAEGYLKENFEKLYYNAVKESCEAEKAKALEDHKQRLAQLEKEHKDCLLYTSRCV